MADVADVTFRHLCRLCSRMEVARRRQVHRGPRRALYWSMAPEAPSEQLVVSEKPKEWGPDLLWAPRMGEASLRGLEKGQLLGLDWW